MASHEIKELKWQEDATKYPAKVEVAVRDGEGHEIATYFTPLSKLSEYVTTTALDTKLKNYVTDNSLTTTLASYVTTSDLTTKLNDYQPKGDYLTSVPLATSSTIGGFKIGYTSSGKNYAIQLDSNGKGYVNVNWSDTTYSVATTGANGLMSSSDKSKLDNIENGANKYTLPNASTSVLGGVKVDGTTTSASNGVITANSKYTVSVSGTTLTIKENY